MAYFVVTTVRGRRWDATRDNRHQDGWDEHAAFMDDLVARHVVVLGGPIGDGVHPVAMLVVEAASAEDVVAELGGDPWKAMDVLHVGDVTPWTIWLDGR